MPDSLPVVLPGNYTTPPEYGVGQSVYMGGVRWFEYIGYALVTDATGVSIALRNQDDLPCTIPAPDDTEALSSNNAAYITHISFYVPAVGIVQPFDQKPIVAGITVGTTDVLKVAASATIDCTSTSTVGAVSGAATSTALPSGEYVSISVPFPGIAVTSSIELKLFSGTAANGAGAAGSNIRTTAAQGNLLIPVRVVYYRRAKAPALNTVAISETLRQTLDNL